ncbi:hypothetical protein ACF06P_35535 [Streptomyces sp. NPDC015684]|uniref:hypothetical protein n=1 Tax=Streptomyces sp. NPDC015684 TaxID=3364963 RepID=UPI0036F9104B
MTDRTALRDRMKRHEAAKGCKRGRVTVRQTGERPVEYVDKRTQQTVSTTAVRSWWETTPAPHFTTEPDSWLADSIPALPALTRG